MKRLLVIAALVLASSAAQAAVGVLSLQFFNDPAQPGQKVLMAWIDMGRGYGLRARVDLEKSDATLVESLRVRVAMAEGYQLHVTSKQNYQAVVTDCNQVSGSTLCEIAVYSEAK
jgi:opacity protein-like surface antigen